MAENLGWLVVLSTPIIVIVGSWVTAVINFDKGKRTPGTVGVFAPIAAIVASIVAAIGGLILILNTEAGEDFFATLVWMWLVVVVVVPAVGLLVLFVGFTWSAIGASRLARPDSRWANARYGPAKMARAMARYPDVVMPAVLPGPATVAPPSAPGVDAPPWSPS
ncbi:MAG: hypothetical protein AAF467_18640 [Actinomycetota bacterium]